MEIDALVIYLPDLDHGVAERLSLGIRDDSAEVGDGPDRGCDTIIDDEEIIVGIEGKLVRVEWPLRVAGSAGEGLGEGSRDSKERS